MCDHSRITSDSIKEHDAVMQRIPGWPKHRGPIQDESQFVSDDDRVAIEQVQGRGKR